MLLPDRGRKGTPEASARSESPPPHPPSPPCRPWPAPAPPPPPRAACAPPPGRPLLSGGRWRSGRVEFIACGRALGLAAGVGRWDAPGRATGDSVRTTPGLKSARPACHHGGTPAPATVARAPRAAGRGRGPGFHLCGRLCGEGPAGACAAGPTASEAGNSVLSPPPQQQSAPRCRGGARAAAAVGLRRRMCMRAGPALFAAARRPTKSSLTPRCAPGARGRRPQAPAAPACVCVCLCM